MIRDAHDFRAGIHDRLLRKLTGRSYSRAGPPGRARLPARRRCARATSSSTTTSTAPRAASATCPTCASRCRCSPTSGRRRGRRVRPGVRPPRRHRRRRARARCRARATSVFEEGLMVPPIRLWDAGRAEPRRRCAIMTRNSRMPESLAADLDAECSRLPDGCAAARRAVRAVRRARRSRPASTRSSTAPPRPTGARSSAEDPGRHLRLGGLRRARRRRRAAAAHPADHADPHRGRRPGRRAAGPRLRPAPGRRPRGRSTTAATTRRHLPQEVAGADPAQPRRHARADGRARRQRGRRTADRDALPASRARCSRRSSRRRPTPAPS